MVLGPKLIRLTLENFISYIKQHQLFTQQDSLLVACSGGVDSMVLCHLLKANHFRFAIAHCNFGLRGNESDADEEMVRKYCFENDVKVYVKRFDTVLYSGQHKLSIQVAARELRYAWFDELLKTFGFHNLLTAHHSDDNVETVLMNLFKGTGIAGMKGILPKRGNIARPLLFATKQDILSYAKQHALEWREDVSNASEKYTRNYFRNRIIPQIEDVIPNASLNVNETVHHLKEAEVLYRQAIEMHRKNLMHFKKEEVHIPVIKFAASQPFETIAYELISPYGFNPAAIEDLKKLLKAETGRYIQSPSHRIIKNRNWLVIAPLASKEPGHIAIDDKDDRVFFENAGLQISRSLNKHIDKDPLVAIVDAGKVSFPLLLRKWKAGDYFYPLGMPKKKKVARFMIDQKMSKTEKEQLWVLESNNRILWLVGKRIDDRFKVNEGTKEILKFRFNPNE